MVNKLTLTILVSIILTVIVISLVNVGTSIILEEPEYDDFCNNSNLDDQFEKPTNEDLRIINEERNKCQQAWEEAQKPYNQNKYYIFALIGFSLLLGGLLFKENMFQITGLASGGILVAEGIVINLQNKIIVFFSLLAILAIFGIVANKVIKKK